MYFSAPRGGRALLGAAQRCGMTQVDHLVIMARTLGEGVAWCEATLGITPGPGGEHAFMGTHNRLFTLASPGFPRAYLEIIAINPVANNAHVTCRHRWFDMDSAALQSVVERSGPQLIHWVARVPQLADALANLRTQGIDRGTAVKASRQTPNGLLHWQISLRDDGQRLFDGCLPTLIAWGQVHPCDTMPESGVTLNRLALAHPQAASLSAALHAIDLPMPVQTGRASLSVELQTPKGLIRLSTP